MSSGKIEGNYFKNVQNSLISDELAIFADCILQKSTNFESESYKKALKTDFDLDLEEIKSVKYEIANGVVTPVAVAAIILRTNKCQNSATNICNIATIDHSKPARTSNFFRSIISVK